MNQPKMTPTEAATILTTFAPAANFPIDDFILSASPLELQEFIHKIAAVEHNQAYNRAKVALSIRLAEDAAKTADTMLEQTKILILSSEKLTNQTEVQVQFSEKLTGQTDRLIQHSEKLTTQTATHIQHSEKLTQQTAELLKESVTLRKLTNKLVFLTVVLGVFTFIQIILMVADIFKHK